MFDICFGIPVFCGENPHGDWKIWAIWRQFKKEPNFVAGDTKLVPWFKAPFSPVYFMTIAWGQLQPIFNDKPT